jgi:hypothetical protein
MLRGQLPECISEIAIVNNHSCIVAVAVKDFAINRKCLVSDCFTAFSVAYELVGRLGE